MALGCWPGCNGACCGWLVCRGWYLAGVFTDIGFRATGNVNYVYGVDATTVAAPGLYTPLVSCGLYPAAGMTAATGALGNNNFVSGCEDQPGWRCFGFNLGFDGLTTALTIAQPVCSKPV